MRCHQLEATALKEVVQIFRNETNEWIHVTVNGEEITCTPNHPFYSPVKGWTSACKLRAGDVLVTLNGEYVVVEQVQHELLEMPEATYNFEVEAFHTYYVGESELLAHNSCNHGNEWNSERRRHWRNEASRYSDPSLLGSKSENGLYYITNDNLERMRSGRAPIGTDNLPVALHHNQGIAVDFKDYSEILTSVHRQEYRSLHPWVFK